MLILKHLFPEKGIIAQLSFGIASTGALVLKNILIPDRNMVHEEGLLSTKRLEHLMYNFQNNEFATETLLAPIITILLPLTIVLVFAKKNKKNVFLQSFLVTFVINTILVILLARAREARLFALPLIFIWPLVTNDILLAIKSRIFHFGTWKNNVFAVIIGFISIASAYFIAFDFYKPTVATEFPNLATKFQLYFFTSMSLGILLFLFAIFRKENPAITK